MDSHRDTKVKKPSRFQRFKTGCKNIFKYRATKPVGELLVHLLSVTQYYRDFLTDIYVLIFMTKTFKPKLGVGGELIKFETQLLFAWAVTLVLPWILNTFYLMCHPVSTMRQRSGLSGGKKNLLRLLVAAFSVLLPATLLYRKDTKEHEAEMIRQDVAEGRKNLSEEKDRLVKRNQEVEKMDKLTVTCKMTELVVETAFQLGKYFTSVLYTIYYLNRHTCILYNRIYLINSLIQIKSRRHCFRPAFLFLPKVLLISPLTSSFQLPIFK